jgi:hypothetical protein
MNPLATPLCVTNDDGPGIFLGASFSLASAIVTAILAPSRGRSAFWWFLIGGFFPWIAILALYLMRDLSYEAKDGAAPHPAAGPPPQSEPALALPQDGWFYADRRQAMGPVSLHFLRGAIRNGTLGRNIPVWCSAFRDWVAPHRVPGFFG